MRLIDGNALQIEMMDRGVDHIQTDDLAEINQIPVTQEPFINKPCISEGVCHEDKIRVLDKLMAEIEQLPTNTRINWDGCCPDIDYPEIEYIDISKNNLLKIIDKYRTEEGW